MFWHHVVGKKFLAAVAQGDDVVPIAHDALYLVDIIRIHDVNARVDWKAFDRLMRRHNADPGHWEMEVVLGGMNVYGGGNALSASLGSYGEDASL